MMSSLQMQHALQSCGGVPRATRVPLHLNSTSTRTQMLQLHKEGAIGSRTCCRATSAGGGGGSTGASGEGGDGELQEQLVDLLQMEVAKAKIKQGILEDLEVRKEGMRLIGQELTEEFEKRVELDKMRMDLATGSTLADALAQFKELDDEIQSIRDQLKADQQDLAAFETRSASQRNSSLFFKQLYQGPPEPAADDTADPAAEQQQPGLPGGQDGQEGQGRRAGQVGSAGAVAAQASGQGRQQQQSLLDPQEVARLSDSIKAPAAQEVRSPLRLYISTYLSLVLLGVMASDLLVRQPPKVGLDLLYAALAAGLGWNAWNERQAIITSSPPAQDERRK